MRPRSISPFPSTFGTTVAINAKLTMASLFGWAAFAMWPGSFDWWGFWLLAGFCAVAAVGLAIEAVRLMVQVYQRERIIEAYLALGGAAKSSEMASDARLRDAGMR
ncbi:hypothetical protein Xaut_0242 [Xanthobacter versatilis]|uniref:Uncharacterized protein n=1 Tax=Xanthobacter autotrophicus (strain ATCC BAA-1158 / Py2) TaxID=78245 RepID=A7IBV7_XANP2|nr:hypothetical protein Xaut_0242 [Xanthobacter autotrophicus Py2]